MLHGDIARRISPPVYMRQGEQWRAADVPKPEADAEADVPELLRELVRIHESAHAVVGHILGLYIERVSAKRGDGRVAWSVPEGAAGRVNYMTALAAGVAAQRRFGARHATYDVHGKIDNELIIKTAAALVETREDIERVVAMVEREAARLVARYWSDIMWFKDALRKLGDYVDEDEIQRMLQDVGKADTAARPAARSAPPPPIDEQLEMDGVAYRRRMDGYLRA